MWNTIQNLEAAQTLAQAIVNTIPEPFLVLDAEFRVLNASRSFYRAFKVDPEHTQGCLLYALGDGQWDIPALRLLLETIIPERAAMDGFEVEHDFPGLGRRSMLLNARKVFYDDGSGATILLAFTDVTERRAVEREKEEILKQTQELLNQKQILLQEMEHRVANSLQIIASILMLKARSVTSEETRLHLRDAHQRVMSVAAVQKHLHAFGGIDRIEVRSYLSKLCESLAASMISQTQPIHIEVAADEAQIESAVAVSIGLIVTELVINALKYAFPGPGAGGLVLVTYAADDDGWKLGIRDDGIGKPVIDDGAAKSGLGTAIVKALVEQLAARIEVTPADPGTRVTITCTAPAPQQRARAAAGAVVMPVRG